MKVVCDILINFELAEFDSFLGQLLKCVSCEEHYDRNVAYTQVARSPWVDAAANRSRARTLMVCAWHGNTALTPPDSAVDRDPFVASGPGIWCLGAKLTAVSWLYILSELQ
jgi:hypothetical protein